MELPWRRIVTVVMARSTSRSVSLKGGCSRSECLTTYLLTYKHIHTFIDRLTYIKVRRCVCVCMHFTEGRSG